MPKFCPPARPNPADSQVKYNILSLNMAKFEVSTSVRSNPMPKAAVRSPSDFLRPIFFAQKVIGDVHLHLAKIAESNS